MTGDLLASRGERRSHEERPAAEGARTHDLPISPGRSRGFCFSAMALLLARK
jgi:hypothetical protein